jgi:hypothetical protein
LGTVEVGTFEIGKVEEGSLEVGTVKSYFMLWIKGHSHFREYFIAMNSLPT